MTEGKKEEGKPPETAKNSEPRLSGKQIVATISVVASLIGILAFFGISNFSQLRHDIIPGPASSTMITPAASYDSPTHTGSAAPTSTTDAPATSNSATFNPASLDSAQRDRTPFTAAALLPASFTDSNNVHYSLIASGQQPCINAAYMTANVRSLLTSSGGCKATTGDYVMTGDYLADGRGIGYGNEIMISVQVFPLASAATAQQIYNAFPTGSFLGLRTLVPSKRLGVPATAAADTEPPPHGGSSRPTTATSSRPRPSTRTCRQPPTSPPGSGPQQSRPST